MLFFIDNLRSHISRSPTIGIYSLFQRSQIKEQITYQAKTEINYLDLHVFIQENILGFNIPMDNIFAVQVCYSFQYLAIQFLRLSLIKLSIFSTSQKLVQAISTSIFHNQINLSQTSIYSLRSFNDIVKQCYTWMLDLLQDHNLSRNILHFLFVQLKFFIHFYCYFSIVFPIHGRSHQCVSPSPQIPKEFYAIKQLFAGLLLQLVYIGRFSLRLFSSQASRSLTTLFNLGLLELFFIAFLSGCYFDVRGLIILNSSIFHYTFTLLLNFDLGVVARCWSFNRPVMIPQRNGIQVQFHILLFDELKI